MSRLSPLREPLAGSGSLVQKIELLRAKLRLAQQLSRPEIERLLTEMNALRTAVLAQSNADSLRSLERLRGTDETGPSAPSAAASELGFEGVLGDSPGIVEALELVRRAAPTDLPLLIDGESGTGKELFARVVHSNSSRAGQPFVSVNCGAIPDSLIESELFGHKKGAFTGASSDRKGFFEAAHGGTIFLDEVGELPMQGQVKLLRVLQVGEIQRLGTDAPIAVDARVVAATNRDLEAMAARGEFREDLFYRLSVIHTSLPPLRERRDEIALLCDFFLGEAAQALNRPRAQLSPALAGFLQGYAYPGNIRELKNLIYRLSCLADGVADLEHLPKAVRAARDATAADPSASTEAGAPTATLSQVKRQASDAAERRYLESGLRASAGRVVDLARELGMNRSHVQTLLKKHGLKAMDFRPGRSG
ncbi:MAG: sigma-54 dependent transcriptional regulator [Pseudomonadota bacterium]